MAEHAHDEPTNASTAAEEHDHTPLDAVGGAVAAVAVAAVMTTSKAQQEDDQQQEQLQDEKEEMPVLAAVSSQEPVQEHAAEERAEEELPALEADAVQIIESVDVVVVEAASPAAATPFLQSHRSGAQPHHGRGLLGPPAAPRHSRGLLPTPPPGWMAEAYGPGGWPMPVPMPGYFPMYAPPPSPQAAAAFMRSQDVIYARSLHGRGPHTRAMQATEPPQPDSDLIVVDPVVDAEAQAASAIQAAMVEGHDVSAM
jgi:hypothetical protein